MPLARVSLLFLLFLPMHSELGAQYAVGAGVTIPTGKFADAARPGWMLAGGWSPWASRSPALRLWVQGYYGRYGADDRSESGGSLAMAGLGLSFKPIPAAATISPYLIGAAGVISRGQGSGRSSGAYIGGGAGISHRRHWLQARYQVASLGAASLSFVLVALGTSF